MEKRHNVYCDIALWKKAQKKAKSIGMNMSQWIRYLIIQALNDK